MTYGRPCRFRALPLAATSTQVYGLEAKCLFGEDRRTAVSIRQFATGVDTIRYSDTWSDLPLASAPANRYQHTAVWTGSQMIVWGGIGFAGTLNTGARFDAASNVWTQITLTAAPTPRYRHTAVWTGSDMIVWGDTPDAGRYNPVTDIWAPVTATGAPNARYGHTAVWSGSEMIVCGGWSGSSSPANEAIT